MMDFTKAVETLKKEYTIVYEKKEFNPEWAYHKISESEKLVLPSIPFVGKNYFEQDIRVLVYASAENLNDYQGNLDNNTIAINRHRYFFENSPDSLFFPCVHMGPMDNGSLALVILYLLSKRCGIDARTPKDLYEKICFGNYGKYAIEFDEEGKKLNRNIDYADDCIKLAESQEYIKKDIEILQPNYIIMIGTMLEKGNQKMFLKEIANGIKIVPIFQLTPTTINGHIKKYGTDKFERLNSVYKEWFDHVDELETGRGAITGNIKENFKAVFAYLDSIKEI